MMPTDEEIASVLVHLAHGSQLDEHRLSTLLLNQLKHERYQSLDIRIVLRAHELVKGLCSVPPPRKLPRKPSPPRIKEDPQHVITKVKQEAIDITSDDEAPIMINSTGPRRYHLPRAKPPPNGKPVSGSSSTVSTSGTSGRSLARFTGVIGQSRAPQASLASAPRTLLTGRTTPVPALKSRTSPSLCADQSVPSKRRNDQSPVRSPIRLRHQRPRLDYAGFDLESSDDSPGYKDVTHDSDTDSDSHSNASSPARNVLTGGGRILPRRLDNVSKPASTPVVSRRRSIATALSEDQSPHTIAADTDQSLDLAATTGSQSLDDANANATSWSIGVSRQVIGDMSASKHFVSVLFRWSAGKEHEKGKDIKIDVVTHTTALLAQYNEIYGEDRSAAVCHAATFTRTCHMPSVQHLAHVMEQWKLAPDLDYTHGNRHDESVPLVRSKCPDCEFRTGQRTPANVHYGITKHFATFHMEKEPQMVVTTASDGSKTYSWSCGICSFTLPKDPGPGKSKIQDKFRDIRRAHLASHVVAWSELRGKPITYECAGCSIGDCPGTWSLKDSKMLAAHSKEAVQRHTCPYCQTAGICDLRSHIRIFHAGDACPAGWIRCNLPIPMDMPFKEIGSILQKALGGGTEAHFLEDPHCAWSKTGLCRMADAFPHRRARLAHYEAKHGDDVWPNDDYPCPVTVNSLEEIDKHHTTCKSVFEDQSALENLDTPGFSARALQYTRQVTKSLLIPQTGRPVMLCVGTDAFSCNVDKLKPWLEVTGAAFDMVIYMTNSSTLSRYMHAHADGTWWGRFRSEALLLAFTKPSLVSAKYRALLKFWREQQEWKDGTSQTYARRNHGLRLLRQT